MCFMYSVCAIERERYIFKLILLHKLIYSHLYFFFTFPTENRILQSCDNIMQTKRERKRVMERIDKNIAKIFGKIAQSYYIK